MMAMLAPDLLDRRALALIRLIDAFGRPVAGPVRIEGEGVRFCAKGPGEYAILAAAGLEAHSAAFEAPPPAPAIGSQHIMIDLTPADAAAAPRRFDLALPRDPDPDHADQAGSLFKPALIDMLPTPRVGQSGSACLVRVSVVRDDDGRRVENALVRGRSDDGRFTARALTDARGEACLVFPTLPLAFPGAGANVDPDLPARVAVTVVPAAARFHAAEDVERAAAAAAGRTSGHADPDTIGAVAADFAGGAPVRLAAGRQPSLALSWQAP